MGRNINPTVTTVIICSVVIVKRMVVAELSCHQYYNH